MLNFNLKSNPVFRLSLYEQIGHKFPHLAQPRLVHGFHVAHRLDFSTVSLE